MSANSRIEWTDTTWNIVTGCTKISAGCLRCYIERTPPFRMAGRGFDSPGIGGTTGVTLHEDRLTAPLRWRKPRRVFVCSLADLFHNGVPVRFIARAFAVMVAAPQHTFQVLTKRHARLRALLTDERFWQMVSGELGSLWNTAPPAPLRRVPPWIWVGVSVESQEWADRRIPALLDVPATVRFLSCEPLLGTLNDLNLTGINWVIVGGESGPGARPMDLDWARSIVQQCKRAGVAVFVKQLGSVWARNAGQTVAGRDLKGGDWWLWPGDLCIREYPVVPSAEVAR